MGLSLSPSFHPAGCPCCTPAMAAPQLVIAAAGTQPLRHTPYGQQYTYLPPEGASAERIYHTAVEQLGVLGLRQATLLDSPNQQLAQAMGRWAADSLYHSGMLRAPSGESLARAHVVPAAVHGLYESVRAVLARIGCIDKRVDPHAIEAYIAAYIAHSKTVAAHTIAGGAHALYWGQDTRQHEAAWETVHHLQQQDIPLAAISIHAALGVPKGVDGGCGMAAHLRSRNAMPTTDEETLGELRSRHLAGPLRRVPLLLNNTSHMGNIATHMPSVVSLSDRDGFRSVVSLIRHGLAHL